MANLTDNENTLFDAFIKKRIKAAYRTCNFYWKKQLALLQSEIETLTLENASLKLKLESKSLPTEKEVLLKKTSENIKPLNTTGMAKKLPEVKSLNNPGIAGGKKSEKVKLSPNITEQKTTLKPNKLQRISYSQKSPISEPDMDTVNLTQEIPESANQNDDIQENDTALVVSKDQPPKPLISYRTYRVYSKVHKRILPKVLITDPEMGEFWTQSNLTQFFEKYGQVYEFFDKIANELGSYPEFNEIKNLAKDIMLKYWVNSEYDYSEIIMQYLLDECKRIRFNRNFNNTEATLEKLIKKKHK